MKDRPILFSGPMVRAILDGRKTVTRRPVKGCVGVVDCVPCSRIVRARLGNVDESTPIRCPFGAPGDRLWVRETWGLESYGTGDWLTGSLVGRQDELIETWELNYRADWGPIQEGCHWRPSIHMQRWASRLTLEVTSVSVGTLADIDDAEAKRDGFATATEATEAIRTLYPDAKWFWRIEFRRID